VLCLLAATVNATDASIAVSVCSASDPIDTSLFSDSIRHWQKEFGRDRDDPRYDPGQVVEIGDHLIEFQNFDGGWPKNVDWLARIDREEFLKVIDHPNPRSSFDNRNTYPQIEYLAKVYCRTGQDRFRLSAEKGLDYLLAQQRPSGGWAGADVDAITYNDSVMTGIMNLLLDIRLDADQFRWVDQVRRERVDRALDRSIRVTLDCQIVVDGTKTAWCQQHDHATLEPVAARKYELASITANESVDVVEFLLRLPDPSPEVREAIRAALAWFEKAAIQGLRVERVPIAPERFHHHTATHDVVATEDPAAPRIWARFYDLETGRPIFCRADGTRVPSLDQVDLERRSGYAWYGGWPERLLRGR
jgi:PelA/Pel-15E family pectate lyase